MTAAGRFTVESRAVGDTEALGHALAALLHPGSVVALYGDLASGKTCFVRGMARHFDQAGAVHSPTFTLVNQYGSDPPFYHLDLYRLGDPDELLFLGYEEIFDGDGICAVEWAERAGDLIPPLCIEVRFHHVGDDARAVSVEDFGVLPGGWEGLMAGVQIPRA